MWRALFSFVSCFLVLCAAASLGWAQLPADDCLSEAGRDSEKAIRYCSAAIGLRVPFAFGAGPEGSFCPI